jgi:hypothetical protein
MQHPKFPLKEASAIVGRDRLNWRSNGYGFCLFHDTSRRSLISIKPDARYPTRIRYPNGEISDVVNLSRAKAAASAGGRKLFKETWMVSDRRAVTSTKKREKDGQNRFRLFIPLIDTLDL